MMNGGRNYLKKNIRFDIKTADEDLAIISTRQVQMHINIKPSKSQHVTKKIIGN